MTSRADALKTARPIAYRSFGEKHGAITRLVSPHHFGEQIKPFVFLDLFDTSGDAFAGFGLHPHSGIATLTYVAEGDISYEETTGARGSLAAGGVEWMRAGHGVWHGGGPGQSRVTRGFQLWLALPPHLELGPSESLYQSKDQLPQIGPARVLIGSYGGVSSSISATSDVTYLAVRLRAGEIWRYHPHEGQEILWIAVGKGKVRTPEPVNQGGLAIFSPGQEPVDFIAEGDAEFMLGSAASHPHDLVTGRYSVHTSAEALAKGEHRIRDIHSELVRQGRF